MTSLPRAPWALALSLAALPALGHVAKTPPRRQRRPPTPSVTPAPAPMCEATLTVTATQGASGCFIDERVTRAPGTLRYPCEGGPATADFSGHVFQGRVDGGRVSLRVQTRFHYGDGCDWATVQTIEGELTASPMAYRYDEAPVAGQRNCASSCHATAEVSVTARGR
ncbi:MAG: hypothetical protein R3A52_04065 [Polyangiales bacterium]